MPKQTRSSHPVAHANVQAPPLAEDADILGCFYRTLKQRGVAVDRRLFGLIFLALVSRFLDHPVCLVIKGSSGHGKSYAIDRTIELFHECAYVKRTAVSEKAIIRTEEPFAHRVLILVEAKGMQSDFGTVMVQNLISDRRINYEVSVQSKDGKWTTVELVKEGPIGMIVSTTRFRLIADLETRLLTVPVPDTARYTRAILTAYTSRHLSRRPQQAVTEWLDLQVWLETVTRRVRVPYLACLRSLCDFNVDRLRRDFPQLDSLIQAHALLHSKSRRRSRRGEILAQTRDYRAVHGLVAALLAEGAAVAVKPEVRQTVEAAVGLMDEDPQEGRDLEDYVTVPQIAKALAVEHSTAWRRVMEAVQVGLLRNLETRRFQPAKIALGEELTEDRPVIPTPDQLDAAWRAWKAERTASRSDD